MSKRYQPGTTRELRYHPDTREQVAQTFQSYNERLSRAFRERIAMLKGRRR